MDEVQNRTFSKEGHEDFVIAVDSGNAQSQIDEKLADGYVEVLNTEKIEADEKAAEEKEEARVKAEEAAEEKAEEEADLADEKSAE